MNILMHYTLRFSSKNCVYRDNGKDNHELELISLE